MRSILYISMPICVNPVLLWGTNVDVLSATSFRFKLLTLFWFFSHDLSIELNAQRRDLPITISSANSSSPRRSAVKGLRTTCGLYVVSLLPKTAHRQWAGKMLNLIRSHFWFCHNHRLHVVKLELFRILFWGGVR